MRTRHAIGPVALDRGDQRSIEGTLYDAAFDRARGAKTQAATVHESPSVILGAARAARADIVDFAVDQVVAPSISSRPPVKR